MNNYEICCVSCMVILYAFSDQEILRKEVSRGGMYTYTHAVKGCRIVVEWAQLLISV